MKGALSVEGGLSVSARVIFDDRDFLVVRVEDFAEMTLEEILTSEDESIRKCSKIIYDKVMEQV